MVAPSKPPILPGRRAAQESVASDVRVLADPTALRAALSPIRTRLLRELGEPASASGLAERLDIPRQRLGYHLRVLEKQGLVHLVEERPRRGFTERLLRRTSHALVVDPEVLGGHGDDESEIQDRFSSAYLVAAAARVIGDVATLREGARKAGKHLATATQETELRFESPAAMREFTDEFAGSLARLVEKYDSPEAAARPYKLMTGMHPRRGPTDGTSREIGDDR